MINQNAPLSLAEFIRTRCWNLTTSGQHAVKSLQLTRILTFWILQIGKKCLNGVNALGEKNEASFDGGQRKKTYLVIFMASEIQHCMSKVA